MERVFKLLSEIQTVEIERDLYDHILKGLEGSHRISILWVRAAAVVLFILSTGTFFAVQQDLFNISTADMTELAPIANNDIYSYE